jgi:hypothetical protein
MFQKFDGGFSDKKSWRYVQSCTAGSTNLDLEMMATGYEGCANCEYKGECQAGVIYMINNLRPSLL